MTVTQDRGFVWASVFDIPRNLVRLIKMCLNEACSRILRGKEMSDTFCIQNNLKHGDASILPLFNFVLE
jgi:hypothetical protein